MRAHKHEKKVKKILPRDWVEVREYWLESLPDIESPGQPPQLTLADLPEVDLILDGIPQDQTKEVAEPLPGLRQGLLHEGVFLLHKAAHVLGSTLVHVSHGMCTWSLSSAYHASFFAMKSALSLLGLTVIETDEKGHYLVDVWSNQKPRKGVKGPVIFIARTGKNQQADMWAYFQRALGTTLNWESFCGNRLRSILLQCDFNEFGKQRHAIHYSASVWDFGDLHKCAIRQGFGAPCQEDLDYGMEDFSLRLAFGVVQMAHKMARQLAQDSSAISAECQLIEEWLEEPFNALYRQNVLMPDTAAG